MKKLLLLLLFPLSCLGATYYVDATNGNDEAAGSEVAPWKSIRKVNATSLVAGDSVLFKRGEVWREQLKVVSGSAGSPITYGSYGTGAKPIIKLSYALTNWTSLGNNLWSSSYGGSTVLATNYSHIPFRFETNVWESSIPVGNTWAKTADDPKEYTLTCVDNGSSATSIQLYTKNLHVTNQGWFELKFKAKCTTPFSMPANSTVHMQVSPYTGYTDNADAYLSSAPTIGTDWTTVTKQFHAIYTATNARATLYLGNVMPEDGAVFTIQPISFKQIVGYSNAPISLDVGNIIINGTNGCWKKWNLADVTNQWDFWHDPVKRRTVLYSTNNPNSYSSVELGLNQYCCYVNGKSYVTIQDLDFRYGSFGVATVTTTSNLVITNCDFNWLGGQLQSIISTGPVRFGNGVELGGSANNVLITGNRFWEIYDAATTPQSSTSGRTLYSITNINNVIWNVEYGYEFNYTTSNITNVYFLNNTLYNIGGGWSHLHRPNWTNGRAFLSYRLDPGNTNIVIKNNIFHTASESFYRSVYTNWFGDGGFVSDYNLFYPSTSSLMVMKNDTIDWTTWQAYSQDANSITNDPLFTDVSALNFTLQASSPALTAGEGGTQMGSSLRLTE